jgi:hypothetical protein
LDDLLELPEEMERDIEHEFGRLDLANGENDEDDEGEIFLCMYIFLFTCL